MNDEFQEYPFIGKQPSLMGAIRAGLNYRFGRKETKNDEPLGVHLSGMNKGDDMKAAKSDRKPLVSGTGSSSSSSSSSSSNRGSGGDAAVVAAAAAPNNANTVDDGTMRQDVIPLMKENDPFSDSIHPIVIEALREELSHLELEVARSGGSPSNKYDELVRHTKLIRDILEGRLKPSSISKKNDKDWYRQILNNARGVQHRGKTRDMKHEPIGLPRPTSGVVVL